MTGWREEPTPYFATQTDTLIMAYEAAHEADRRQNLILDLGALDRLGYNRTSQLLLNLRHDPHHLKEEYRLWG